MRKAKNMPERILSLMLFMFTCNTKKKINMCKKTMNIQNLYKKSEENTAEELKVYLPWVKKEIGKER